MLINKRCKTKHRFKKNNIFLAIKNLAHLVEEGANLVYAPHAAPHVRLRFPQQIYQHRVARLVNVDFGIEEGVQPKVARLLRLAPVCGLKCLSG